MFILQLFNLVNKVIRNINECDEIIYQLEAKMFLLTSGLPASAADLLDK